jgi:hypothetical protein
MSDEKKKDDLVNVENIEIDALDDKELESVAGGYTDTVNNTAASCACCAAGATAQVPRTQSSGTQLA